MPIEALPFFPVFSSWVSVLVFLLASCLISDATQRTKTVNGFLLAALLSQMIGMILLAKWGVVF